MVRKTSRDRLRMMGEASTRRTLALYACFFFSGAAGLIYEVLWAKYLALYVGGTGLAQIIVLATFMGGIATGSRFFGNRADRTDSPLKLYAFLEFGIGVYALLFEPIYSAGHEVFIGLVHFLGAESGALAPISGKIAGSALTILLPTFLMGGTLPLLGRHMIRTMQSLGPKISRLYFLNSFGAVVGCLLAGFYLIQAYGLQFSMVIGGALNIGVGLVAFVLAKREETVAHQEPSGEKSTDGSPLSREAGWLLLGAVGVSGAVSMMVEVAWIRMLALVLGSSTYAFSLMLATFILGLSLGGLILSFRRKPTGYLWIFGLSSIGVGLTVLLSLPFYVRLPYLFNQIAASLSREPETYSIYQLCQFLLCALVMIIPTILQGITLPAATKVLTRKLGHLGRRLGAVFAINTIGTLVGVAFAGFLGLPGLGIKGTLELAVILNVVFGLAVLWIGRSRPGFQRLFFPSVATVLVVAFWYSSAMGPWDQEVFSAGVYRTRNRIPSYDSLQAKAHSRETLFYRDGVDATVAVQDQFEKTPQRVLIINGKVDASTVGDLPTQKSLAHLPLLLHPGPEDVLVVGIGSGATVGSVLAYDVDRVDTVELSRDVIDASRLFDSVNGRYWEDPRVRVHWEDAKTFLQITDRKYDVIISEPTNPWIAGIAGVFSKEYYEACRERLAPRGLFVQWIQTYELEDTMFLLMVNTFRSVFPYYTLWNPAGSDVILIGSARPYELNRDRMAALMAQPRVRDDLALFGVESMLGLLGTQMADHANESTPDQNAGVQAVHSDFFPILEYMAPRGFFLGRKASGLRWIDQRLQSPANAKLWVMDDLANRKLPPAEFAAAYRQMHRNMTVHGTLLDSAWAKAWLARDPDNPIARAAVGASEGFVERVPWKRFPGEESKDKVDRLVSKIRRLQVRFGEYSRTRSFLGPGDAEPLLEEVAAVMDKNPEALTPDMLAIRGELEYDLGRHREAVGHLGTAARAYQKLGEPEALVAAASALCRVQLDLGNVRGAAAAYREFLAPYAGELRVRLLGAEIVAVSRSP